MVSKAPNKNWACSSGCFSKERNPCDIFANFKNEFLNKKRKRKRRERERFLFPNTETLNGESDIA